MRRTRIQRAAWPVCTVALWLATAACAAVPTDEGDDAPTGGGAPTPASEGTTPAPTADGADADEASGAEVRLVNLWASADAIGPAAVLRVLDDQQVLVEAAPGEISDYVAVPTGGFFDRPAALEVIAADTRPTDEGREVRDIEEGERVTIFVEGSGEGIGDDRRPTVSQFGASSWPTVGPDKITLLAYPGPLTPLPIEEDGIALATVDDRCLVDETGEEQRLGWGGLPMYLVLDAGTTEIAVSHFPHPGSGCQPNDPIGTVTVTGQGGERFALLPWGTSGNVDLLLLEMDPQP